MKDPAITSPKKQIPSISIQNKNSAYPLFAKWPNKKALPLEGVLFVKMISV